MHIIEILNNFKKEYQTLISNFSIIDECDPITPMKLNDLANSLDSWLELLNEEFKKHADYWVSYKKNNSSFWFRYEQEVRILNNSLKKNIKKVKNDTIIQTKKIRENIENAKKENNLQNEQIKRDYEYFLTTSELNKKILDTDYIEAKKRFDYQKDEAKESYIDIVKKKNKELDEKEKQLYDDYQIQFNQFESDNIQMIEKLQKLIKLKTIELNNINNALINEKNSMKEKYRLESADLNNQIKKINDVKNKDIVQARNQYNKALSDANIEKENKKASYQAQTQKHLKEFVTKINEIDENTNEIKKKFEDLVENYKKEYYANSYKKNSDFHNQINHIYQSTDSDVIDKYIKKLIKIENKDFQKKYNKEKKEAEKVLLNLYVYKTKQIQENRNNKNLLEIDKNFAIKNYTDLEQFDNKFYQEQANIYESEFNYSVKIANYNFSILANNYRTKSQIRTKLLERNFNGKEAAYSKKIESIQSKINLYKLEIDLATALRKTINNYQNETYHNQLNLTKVTNLLDIEKNKLLHNYNNSRYDYNVQTISELKNYGYKKIDLDDAKSLKMKDLKIEENNLNLEKNKINHEHLIKKEKIKEEFSITKLQIVNNNDLKTSKENYICSLENNDLNYLKQIYSSFASFSKSINRNYLNIMSIILKDIYPNSSNYKYLKSFINSFSKEFINLYIDVFLNIYNCIIDVIEAKVNYIYNFKYKSSIDIVNDLYNHELNIIIQNKNELTSKIDDAYKTIKNFYNKILTLENDKEMILAPFHNRKKAELEVLQQVKKTDISIKEYKDKIIDYNKMIKLYNEELYQLNTKIRNLNKNHDSELKKFNNLFQKEIFIYSNFKEAIQNHRKKFETKKTFLQFNYAIKTNNEKHLLKATKNKINSVIKLNNINNYKLGCLVKNFVDNCEKDIHNRMRICKSEFTKDIKKYNQKYNSREKEFKKEYNSSLATIDKKIKNHEMITNKSLKRANTLLENAKYSFETISSQINSNFNETTNIFYNNYYALEENLKKIIEYHKKIKNQTETNFKNTKQQYLKENNSKKKNLDNYLKNFIKNKDIEINNLPIVYKYQQLLITNENKKSNLEITKEMKMAKNELSITKKQIEKEIVILKTQLNAEKVLNEIKQKQNIVKEKKNNRVSLKQAIKNVKINLE